MFMCFRGGGVGHKSFQGAIKKFCDDRWPDGKNDNKQQAGGMPVDSTASESEDKPKNIPTQPSSCEADIKLPDNVDKDEGIPQSGDELDGSLGTGSESDSKIDEGEQPVTIQPKDELQDEDELEYEDF